MRVWISSVLLAACVAGSDSKPGLADGGEQRAAIQGLVTNSAALTPPELQAVILWPNGGMSPSGTFYGANPVNVIGDGFPAQFTIDLSSPPPAEVLTLLSSLGMHAVMGNVAVVRAGSLSQSGAGSTVAACDVWGTADKVLIHMTEPGPWLSSQYGFADTTSYSQGYHLFASRMVDAGPCMDPMCGSPQVELVEVPWQTQLVVDLRSPDTWCR